MQSLSTYLKRSKISDMPSLRSSLLPVQSCSGHLQYCKAPGVPDADLVGVADSCEHATVGVVPRSCGHSWGDPCEAPHWVVHDWHVLQKLHAMQL